MCWRTAPHDVAQSGQNRARLLGATEGAQLNIERKVYGFCSAVACSPDGRIWTTCEHTVRVHDADGAFLQMITDESRRFSSAKRGIAFDAHGDAYVADELTGQILVCRDGKVVRRIVSTGTKRDYRLLHPVHVAVDAKQKLLFVQSGTDRDSLHVVKVRTLDGRFVRAFSQIGRWPKGIAVNGTEVAVVDGSSAQCVVVFEYSGKLLRRFGHAQLHTPRGISVDADRNWLVCDELKHRCQVFSREGQWLTSFGEGILDRPRSICVDAEGRVLVSDVALECVFVFGFSRDRA